MAKKKGKKGKDVLLAEIAYRAGVFDAFELDGVVNLDHVDEMVETGADRALKKWKEQTGGRKPELSDIELARKEWIAASKPLEGIRYPNRSNVWYKFKPDGVWDEIASFNANIGGLPKD